MLAPPTAKAETKRADAATARREAQPGPEAVRAAGPVPRGRGGAAPRGNQAALRALAPRPPVTLQRKLTVGAVDDPLEREADQAAERVMRSMAAGAAPPGEGHVLRRACASCEEEEKQALRRKATDALAGGAVPDSVHRTLGEAGTPLDAETRSAMERGFGRDFSDVRLHLDGSAGESARDVSARAYTVGQHIAFAPGMYQPGSSEGRRLLAHELAHVVQQRGAPALRRDFDSTVSLCEDLYSRRFKVDNGAVTATIEASVTRPAEGAPGRYIYVALVRTDTTLNHTIATNPVPVGAKVVRTWTGLEAGEYMLSFSTHDDTRKFCVSGTVSVSTAAAAAGGASVPLLPSEACYDGDQIYVSKGGKKAACAALSGTVGEPIPTGTFCVRHQGEAQNKGGLTGRAVQDRSKWFLLEPQFETTRSRMMLHPGVMSAGCITVMDRGCFDGLAAVLNDGATTKGKGRDGYPPGNSAGVDNPEKEVDCVGTLTVAGRIGGCVAAGPPAPPQAAPAAPAEETLQRMPAGREAPVLRRQPAPPAPQSAGGADPGAWLTLFAPAQRSSDSALSITQYKTTDAPTLANQDKGGSGAALTPEQTAAKAAIVAARAAAPSAKLTLGRDEATGLHGWKYGGTSPVKPSKLVADAQKPADDEAGKRAAAVRDAVWSEVTENEGGASAINAYDPARLTWGPGMTMDGPLVGALDRTFADPKAKELFLRCGIAWQSGAFSVMNEANNAVETGNPALQFIQARKDLLAVFIAVAENPDTGQVVADSEFDRIAGKIQAMPAAMRTTWDLDVMRVGFHLNYWLPAHGYSAKDRSDVYDKPNPDAMELVLAWGRAAAGKPEANGASLISSPGFALAITQFRKWGRGVAMKAIEAACPVPVVLSLAEARDPDRKEFSGLVLLRTLEATKGKDAEPLGYYILPRVPGDRLGSGQNPAAGGPYYYDFYELNGIPKEYQTGRAERYSAAQLEALLKAWNDPASGLKGSFSLAVGVMLQAVQVRKQRTAKTPKPDPAAQALADSDDFKTLAAKEPDRAAVLRGYLGL